jgi:hypothetical protein
MQGKFLGVPSHMDPGWRSDRQIIEASLFSVTQSAVDRCEVHLLEGTEGGDSSAAARKRAKGTKAAEFQNK